MNITILGCGALGQIWLTALARQGHLLNSWLKTAQLNQQFEVTALDGEKYSPVTAVNSFDDLQRCELLIVTLKAHQISNGIRSLLPELPGDCPILLMHNGLGVIEELPEISQPLLHAVTTQAAMREGRSVRHMASGLTQIGPLLTDRQPASSEIADMLHQALPDVAWYNDIRTAAWNKLAVSCMINPLTVKYQCANGALKAHQQELYSLCQELNSVLQREGIHSTTEQLFELGNEVIRQTAQNISSMLQDIRAQRTTEIDYITSYLLQRASVHGLSLPAHHALNQLVKHQENTHLPSPGRSDLPGSWQQRQ